MKQPKDNVSQLLDLIVEKVPHPVVDLDKDFTMLVSQTESNTFFGKMLIGRVNTGRIAVGDKLVAVDNTGKFIDGNKVTRIIRRYGMNQVKF